MGEERARLGLAVTLSARHALGQLPSCWLYRWPSLVAYRTDYQTVNVQPARCIRHRC